MNECAPVKFQIMYLGRHAVSREDAFHVGQCDFHVFSVIWIEDITTVINAYNIIVVVYIFAGSRAFSDDARIATTVTAVVFGDI